MTNYIHFEDGRDVVRIDTYTLNGRRKYFYQYGCICFSRNKQLNEDELRLVIKNKENNKK